MMHMDDSDPDQVQTPLDGPAGLRVRAHKPLPLDPAHEDWVPTTLEASDDGPEDPQESPRAPQDEPDGPVLPQTIPGQDKTSQEPPKRKRGRPRKPVVATPIRSKADMIRTDAAGVRADQLKHFPKPPAYFFKPENAGSHLQPPAFFTYLGKVAEDSDLASRIILYVYRTWPVMNPEGRQIEKTADILQYGDVERRYGMGDYHLKLNDAGLGKTVCMVNLTGLRNEEYPAVLDTLQVDTSDPANKSWIARQRSKGLRFDGDAGDTGRNEDSMAEVATVQALTGSLDKMTNKVMDMADKRGEARQTQPSVEQEAVSRGLDIVAQAATMGNQMMQTAVNRLSEQASNTPDPMMMMDRAFGMAKDFLEAAKPDHSSQQLIQANDHSQIIEIMKMQQEQQQKFHDTLFQMQQGQINKLEQALMQREQAQTVSMEVAQRPRTLIEQINEMKEAKDAFREVLGLGDDDGGGKQSWLAENGPMLLQGITVLGSVISTGLYNLAVIKTGQGQPAQPPGPEMVLSPDQQENLREHGIPVGGQPAHSTPAGQPFSSQPVASSPTMDGDDMLNQYHRFLEMIRPSLLKAFQEGASGDEYAETMITLGDNGYFGAQLNGAQVYSMVKENGKPAIMALIKTFPGIWDVVRLTPLKWEEFMSNFFQAEELWAKLEDEENSNSERVRTAG